MDCHSLGSAGHPRPSDLTSFHYRPVSTSDFQLSGFALILHLSSFCTCSLLLVQPLSLLAPSLPWSAKPMPMPQSCPPVAPPWTFGVTLALWRVRFTLVPFLTISASVSWPPSPVRAPQVYTMAPPFIGSTMDLFLLVSGFSLVFSCS